MAQSFRDQFRVATRRTRNVCSGSLVGLPSVGHLRAIMTSLPVTVVERLLTGSQLVPATACGRLTMLHRHFGHKLESPEAEVNDPRLLAISGLLKGTLWPARGGPLFVGRDPSNQVRADASDATVSRRHCSVIEVSSGVFEIADLDSHNGTFVNG